MLAIWSIASAGAAGGVGVQGPLDLVTALDGLRAAGDGFNLFHGIDILAAAKIANSGPELLVRLLVGGHVAAGVGGEERLLPGFRIRPG